MPFRIVCSIALLAACAVTVWGQSSTVAPRVFAPGVETVIPPNLDPSDTTSRHDVVELRTQEDLAWDPELLNQSKTAYSLSSDARFEGNIWCLEFGFKPLRMIRLEPSGAETGAPSKLVWYLVYRVKNTGEMLSPTGSEETGDFEAKLVPSTPIRFSPHFVLQGQDVGPNGGKLYRSYLDQVIPGAFEAIRQRETPRRRLLTSVQMPLEPIEPGEEAWGVVMWEKIDPEMDFFSLFIRGLTNAYEWTDPPGAYQAGDSPGKGREFTHKMLQLNFWRPGDRFMQHESEVRYGVPPGKSGLYGVDEGVAYRWVYR